MWKPEQHCVARLAVFVIRTPPRPLVEQVISTDQALQSAAERECPCFERRDGHATTRGVARQASRIYSARG